MKKKIINIMNKSNFSNELINFFLEEHTEAKYRYFSDEILNDKRSIDAKHDGKDRLLFSMYSLYLLKLYYEKMGIDLEIYYKTIKDLDNRAMRYLSEHNRFSLSDTDLLWFGYILDGLIYQIGELKYQLFSLKFSEIERFGNEAMVFSKEMKEKYPEGLKIINIHILKDANISEDNIDESLTLARNFINEYFNDENFQYFFCRSWLLYPKLKGIMNPKSNIIRFQDRFKIIATHNNPSQAFKRIYNTDKKDKIINLTKTSSLQKIAFERSDALGVGLGIIKI